MLRIIAANQKYAFTKWADDWYYLNPAHFDSMLDQIRLGFWNHRRSRTVYDASKIVKERVPLGSQFTVNGYLLPDGTFINKQMREQVSKVNATFRAVQVVQSQLQTNIPPEHLQNLQSRTLWTASQAKSMHNRQDPRKLPEGWPETLRQRMPPSRNPTRFGKSLNSVDRSDRRECNNLSASESSSPSSVFLTTFTVYGKQTRVMIDSGAGGSFISERFVRLHGIATRQRSEDRKSVV